MNRKPFLATVSANLFAWRLVAKETVGSGLAWGLPWMPTKKGVALAQRRFWRIVGLMLVAAVGGKACRLLLTVQPMIGPVAAWHMGYIGPTSNLIYGATALQIVLMALAQFLYGPAFRREVMAGLRAYRVVAHG